ncbi:MAG: Glu-tRNA(Gln) amidotransferase GatDE subunit E, partial [Candidatus Altiarchaeota archaeon]|nr:Glu-tRNA(Gln) amidotransferase GatDE subunit E [Candidatus Altiarchaeota archaeon]
MVKIGLEIHQQLNTEKLFCSCPTELSDSKQFEFSRKLRPVISELGQVDRAALQEHKKGKTITYYANSSNSCAVEWDEEPPHEMNRRALEITLQFAKLLDANPVDEIQVMRKILIDGSAVSG